jgi:hypothetical protein
MKIKLIKLFICVAFACLLTVVLPGAAYAQLGEIIADYCEEVLQNSENTLSKLEDATIDLLDCANDYDNCGTGLFGEDPVDCISDYRQCISRGNREQDQACNTFLNDLRSDTRTAESRADRADVEDGFLLWFHDNWDDPASCLAPARTVSSLCAGLTTE